MKRPNFYRQILWACGAVAIAGVLVQAQQTQTQDFKPEVGQPGKDVVWVPTPQVVVDKMLDMAGVTKTDFVMDLGSGDGRTVITAAKRGATAVGIEYNPDMVELSKRNAVKEGVPVEKAAFMKADLFETDFSRATVITMFLLPDINIKLRPKLLNLKPGTRIVSNTFTMGEWNADQIDQNVAGCEMWCTALLWIVPAKVDGTWKLPQGDLTLKQEFQMLSGTLKSGADVKSIAGKLRGDQITFQVAGNARTEYTGKVNGASMSGTLNSGGTASAWSATRIGG
jgi:phospholipid N-methyltransferase